MVLAPSGLLLLLQPLVVVQSRFAEALLLGGALFVLLPCVLLRPHAELFGLVVVTMLLALLQPLLVAQLRLAAILLLSALSALFRQLLLWSHAALVELVVA